MLLLRNSPPLVADMDKVCRSLIDLKFLTENSINMRLPFLPIKNNYLTNVCKFYTQIVPESRLEFIFEIIVLANEFPDILLAEISFWLIQQHLFPLVYFDQEGYHLYAG